MTNSKNLFSPNVATGGDTLNSISGFHKFIGTEPTLERVTTDSHNGTGCIHGVINSGGGIGTDYIAIAPNMPYACSIWIKCTTPNITLNLVFMYPGAHTIAGTSFTTTGDWQPVIVTYPGTTTAATSLCAYVRSYSQNAEVYLDEMQLEEGSTATSWENPNTCHESFTLNTTSSVYANVKKTVKVTSAINTNSQILSNIKKKINISTGINVISTVTANVKKIIKITSSIYTNSTININFHDILHVTGAMNTYSSLNSTVSKIMNVTGNVYNDSTIEINGNKIKKTLKVLMNLNNPSFLESDIIKLIKVKSSINETSFSIAYGIIYNYIESIKAFLNLKKPSTKIMLKSASTIIKIIK